MADKLTIKQEKFAQGLFAGLTQREAYRQAYNAEKMKDATIDRNAHELANDNKITTRIKELQDELKAKNMLTIEWVLNNLKEVTERCLQTEPVLTKVGNDWVESGEYTFQHAGANKALELIGKHLGMFTDKVEQVNHNLNQDITNMTAEERKKRIAELKAKL